jgi:WD40 repeat protein
VFNATTGAEIFCLAHGSNAVNKVVFSPNGTHLATASFSFIFGPSGDSRYGGSTVRVFDATTGAEIWHTDRGDLVNKVVFSPNGTRLAAAVAFRGGDPGGTAWVFDATTGAEIWRVEHDWEVCTVVFSPDGTRLATASGPVYDPSGEARVFDAATGAEIWRVDHGNPVYSVVFSPDGTRLAATSGKYRETGQARVFDAATGAEIWRVDHGNPVHAVVFSPDGTRLATGSGEYRKHSSGDGDARVFDAATGAEIWRVDHGNPVRAVAFSPDGTRLATGSGVDLLNYPYPRDGRVRLFDVANGAEVSRLDHGNPVRAVAFSPDGTQLASSDDSARVWCVDHSQLIEQALGRLTRNLTRQEWSSYFHEEPYRKTRADLA